MPNLASPKATELLLEALAKGQMPYLTVRSDSMAPMFRKGDDIQLARINDDGPSVGDVIVIGPVEDLLAHRYWGPVEVDEGSQLLTRGDRLAYYDPLWSRSQLRAMVVARRRAGKLLAFDRGRGAWLNRRLGQLAHLEARMMHLSRPSDAFHAGEVASYGSGGRLARRMIYVVAWLLNTLTSLSTS